MTNISKISRSIIVVFFIAFMLFFGYQNIMISTSLNEETVQNNNIPGWMKIVYIVVLIILVIMYVYLKEKLYKIKVKRKNSLIIRYIYLVIIGGITSYLSLFRINSVLDILDYILLIVFSVSIGLIVKKIIFNVSKSDILSVIGMFSSTMMIDITKQKTELYIAQMIALFVMMSIYFMQLIIDELKQKGIKNRKYVTYSVFLGISSGFSILVGINPVVYLILIVLMFFISSNLDYAHITFSRKMIEGISKEKREFLFKIERINISKLLISCMLVVLIIAGMLFGTFVLLKYTSVSNISISIVQQIIDLLKVNFKFSFEFSFTNLIVYFRDLSSMSKMFYLILTIYMIFMEVLAFILNRRYDTKSTAIKILFMLIFACVIFLKLNLYLYQPLFSIMFVLICIVNTSNMYLNREERIKLLVA